MDGFEGKPDKNRIGRMSKGSDEMNKGWRGKFGVTGIQAVT